MGEVCETLRAGPYDGLVQISFSMKDLQEKQEVSHLYEEINVYMAMGSTDEKSSKGFIDTACPNSVGGIAWVKAFISLFPSNVKALMILEHSDKVFKFGGGEVRRSLGHIKIPCQFTDRDGGKSDMVTLGLDVVDAEIPLLIGAASLVKAGAIMDIGEMLLSLPRLMGGQKKALRMSREPSGHFALTMYPVSEWKGRSDAEKILLVDDWNEEISELMVLHVLTEVTPESMPTKMQVEKILVLRETQEKKELTRKEVTKLHHYFGHVHPNRLKKVIIKAGRMTEQVRTYVDELTTCEVCALYRPKVPRPAVALPRAVKFNQIVTLDLKENTKWKAPRYVLYAIDMCTRFKMGVFIADKKKETVVHIFSATNIFP